MSSPNHLQFTICPVAKARPRVTRTGHVYTPKKTADFEQFIKLSAKAQRAEMISEGPISVIMLFTFSNLKKNGSWHCSRPDLDNLVKAVSDALNGIAWKDDCQIASLTCQKRYEQNTTEGSIEIFYRSLT